MFLRILFAALRPSLLCAEILLHEAAELRAACAGTAAAAACQVEGAHM